MDFHLYLANHHPYSFALLEDVVRPVIAGLEDDGHRVVSFSTDIVFAPRINLFVEYFYDQGFVDTILALKKQLGDGFLFGVICTEDLADPLVWKLSHADRLTGLKRILPHADFVWTLLAPGSYREFVAPECLARIEYGYSARLLPPVYTEDPAQRDIDVLIYGSSYKYRMSVSDEIRRRGLSCEYTISAALGPGDKPKMQGLPETYITSFYLPPAKAALGNQLTAAFPNITVVNTDLILRQIQNVLDQVIAAVEFLFVFTLLAGVTVLYAALSGARDERKRDAGLLKALGAPASLVRQTQYAEFLVVGGLAGFLASLGAIAVGWGLSQFVFDFPYRFNGWIVPVGVVSGMLCAFAGGWLGLREVLRQPALATLREVN